MAIDHLNVSRGNDILLAKVDDTERSYLINVALASKNIAEHCPEDQIDETLEMLGLGEHKFTNEPSVKRVRRNYSTKPGAKHHPETVSSRVRDVRMRAMQMDWMVTSTDSTRMDG